VVFQGASRIASSSAVAADLRLFAAYLDPADHRPDARVLGLHGEQLAGRGQRFVEPIEVDARTRQSQPHRHVAGSTPRRLAIRLLGRRPVALRLFRPGQPEPGFRFVGRASGTLGGMRGEFSPARVTFESRRLATPLPQFGLCRGARGDLRDPRGRRGKIHVLPIQPAISNHPQQPAGFVEQAAAFRPWGNRRRVLDQRLAAALADRGDDTVGNADAEPERVAHREHARAG
jgi:hypothetical protein